jgi:hypothetical protein
MGGEFIGTYFFVPTAARPASDDELFQRLGYDAVNRRFGGLDVVDARIEVLSDHVCVKISSLAASFLNLRMTADEDDLPLERDPGLPLARAIRDGAARSEATVAILATREAMHDKIPDCYWMVLVGDADALAAEYFGLLYLNDRLAQGWDPPAGHADRDELPGGPGRILFGHRGWHRWY